eukprot:CAMPEP_0197192754 /NCGR_PEP_ID=MMETSP1423-20130617/25674_1 /TAXON_ID=476441 /ORGANISM="Pseudo-nitzschia heimii, Strain UNC1101" /LENGTH=388 /DNA_ID=CAMNT_0042645715 /DNA_START=106 /DNA_END=1272 /DNA_ORIENTATION=-
MKDREGDHATTEQIRNSSSEVLPISASPAAGTSGDSRINHLTRCILIVSYDGTRYCGFQRQSSSPCLSRYHTGIGGEKTKRRRPNNEIKKKVKNRGVVTTTVQEIIEDALEFYTGLTREELRMRFAGRTDSGVHARGQVVVVSLPSAIVIGNEATVRHQNTIDMGSERLWKIRKSINSRLPNDISIENVSECDKESFDPRLDAKSKQYSYLLRYRELKNITFAEDGSVKDDERDEKIYPICLNGGPPLLRTALDSNRVWICPWALDDSKLERYCEFLSGTHDYSAFVHKEARNTRNNQMTIDRLFYERTKFRDDKVPIWEVRFFVEAKGFGRAQVRNIVGFLVDVCRGSFKDQESSPDWFWKADPKRLAQRINSAPANGLCLEQVIYK